MKTKKCPVCDWEIKDGEARRANVVAAPASSLAQQIPD